MSRVNMQSLQNRAKLMFTSGEPNQVYKPRNEISDTETNQVYKPGHTSHKSGRGQPVAASDQRCGFSQKRRSESSLQAQVKPKNQKTNQVYKPGPPLPNPNEHLGPYAREASGSDTQPCDLEVAISRKRLRDEPHHSISPS